MWADAPSDLAAGESSAPKSPAVAPNPAASAASGPAANQAVAEPYDFKGTKLGITIDQFRKAPFPDTPSPDLGGLKKGPVRVFCNPGEDVLDLLRSGDEEVAGVTKCGFYRGYIDKKLGKIKLPPTHEGLQMGGGQYACRYCDFDFIRDPADGVPKLFKITLLTHIKAMPDVLDALTEKFGLQRLHLRLLADGFWSGTKITPGRDSSGCPLNPHSVAVTL